MKIYNAKICTMESEIIANGYVEINNGIISEVCAGNPKNVVAEDIDACGRTIYPGFVDAHTHLGLISNGVGVEGDDINEATEPITPHLRVIDGINAMDKSFAEAREAGVTTAIVMPGSSNPIAGNVVAIKTDGVRIDKMFIRNVGIKFALGENPKMSYGNDSGESPSTRMAVVALIREMLIKASKYNEDLQLSFEDEDVDKPEYDIKCEELLPLIRGEVKAHFHCHRADDIFTAIRIAKEFKLDYVLVHCTEGHLIADELAEENASAIIGPMISDRSKPELANLTIANPSILQSRGIEVAISTDHSEVPIQYLALSAGIAVRGGLDKDEALRAITINAARISGIDDLVGSIKKGKYADLVLFRENPLDVRATPDIVIIGGKVVFDKNNGGEKRA